MRVDFSKFSSVKIGAELEVAELNEVCDLILLRLLLLHKIL